MKRTWCIVVLVIGIFVAWGSLTSPAIQPAQAAIADPVICCSEGGPGLPPCGYTTWGMYSYNSLGQLVVCHFENDVWPFMGRHFHWHVVS